MVEITPRSSARLRGRELVAGGDHLLEAREQARPHGGVALRAFRALADDEALAFADAHLLDAQAGGHLLVAAGPGEGRLGLGGARAQLLAEDVVLVPAAQEAAVLGGGEAAIGDPDDAREGPVAKVVFDLADERRVGGVARPGPDAHRDALAGHGHADHHLGQVVAVVLGVAVGAKAGAAAGLALAFVVGCRQLAALVARHGLVGLIRQK